MRSENSTVRLIALFLIVFLFLGLTLRVLANGQDPDLEGREDSVWHIGNVEKAAILADPDVELLYRFTGVTDDGSQGGDGRKVATSIHCTNVDSLEVATVEVQVYQGDGSSVYTGTVDIVANWTFTFSTQETAIYFDDLFLGGPPGTPAILQGSGQIFSSHDKVICTAQALDPLNYPPEFVVRLPMFDGLGYPVSDVREVDLPVIVR